MSSRRKRAVRARTVQDPEDRLRLEGRLALRPAEAAHVLGISERTLRQILPQIPHLRAGTAVLIPVDGLREWLREQAHTEAGQVAQAVEETMERLSLDT